MVITPKLITPATKEPVSQDEAKLWVKEDFSQNDALLSSLITAARQHCEMVTRRQFVTATWEVAYDNFACMFDCGWDTYGAYRGWACTLDLPPLQSVEFIKYVDENGDEQTLDAANYHVDTRSEPGRIISALDASWPTTKVQPNAVTVRFLAGYGTTDSELSYTQNQNASVAAVPATIKTAIKLLVAHWYVQREAVGDAKLATVPMAVESLLAGESWGSYR